MKNISPHVTVIISLLLVVLMSSELGCTQNGTATIDFKQVGACSGWKDGNTLHSAGPNAAYVVFKVHSIDNSQGKVDFAFDPSKVSVNAGSHPHMDSSLSLAQFIGVFQLVPTTIPQSKVVGLDGFAVAVVPTSNANGAVEANKTSYFLLYDTGSNDPGVLYAKENPSQTTWTLTENCTDIRF